MDWQYPVYAMLVLAAGAITGALAVYAWSHRSTAGATSFAIASLLSCWIAIGETLSIFSTTPDAALFWFNARYAGLAFAAVAWLAFALEFTGRGAWLTRRRLSGLLIVPLVSQVVIWVDPLRSLWTLRAVAFRSVPPFMIADLSERVPGVWFWIYLSVGTIVMLAATGLIVQASRTRVELYHQQASMVWPGIIAGLLLIGILPMLPIQSILKVNPTVPGLLLGNLMVALAVFRYQFLNLSPLARDALIDRMTDSMLVLDMQNRVVDLNPAMRRWLEAGYAVVGRTLPPRLIGQSISDVFSPWANLSEFFRAADGSQSEIGFESGGRPQYWDIRPSLLTDRHGRPVGRLFILRDITARKAADASLQKLSRAVHCSPVSIVITDAAGLIEYVNPKFSEVTGYTLHEAIGQTSRILKSHLTPPEVHRELWATILSGREWRGEFANRKKNGEIYRENAVIAPIVNDLGETTHFVAVKEDITERTRAEAAVRQSEAQYRLLAENMVDVVWTMNPAGQFTYVSPSVEKLRGYTPQEVLAQSPAEALTPASLQTMQDALQATMPYIRRGARNFELEAAAYELEQPRKGGGTVWTEALVKTLFDECGNFSGFLGVSRDISKRKQAEDALRQYTVELEASNAELDAFAHTVAHDLNSPLGVIMGFSELLEKNFEVLSHEDMSDSLSRMAQTSRKMSRIVKELLLLASVRKMDEVNVCVLDTRAIVAETLERSADLMASAGAQIVLPETWPAAMGYGPWVEEIWSNYISNAIKYGGTPPRVELGADLAGERVRFWVRDNGAGLTAEQQTKLFTEFARVHTTRVQGHGLGLSIVRRIAEKLGGRAGVESEVGRGSLFYFTLPAWINENDQQPLVIGH